MTLFTPVYDTPLNQPGLAHKSTYLELNKNLEFNPLYAIYAHTHDDDEKSSFTIAYRLVKNEVVYARYKILFEDGSTSPFSPVKTITANKAIKEYTLDSMSAVPATPRLAIIDYNNSDIPHEDITVTISDLKFYMGDGVLVATSWYLKDVNDNLLWKSENDKFNLNKVTIPRENYKNNGIYRIEANRIVKTGLATYNSLRGIKIINVTDGAGYTNADKAIEVDYDNFKLFENRQSTLRFKQKIQGFEYLSVKIYDRNGILVFDEIKTKVSPLNINTAGIAIGKEYTFKITAFYIDSIEGIKNTRIDVRSFVAERSSESNTIMTVDYKNILKVGFAPLKEYKDENIILPNLTENLNNGEALLFIRDNLFFIGQWLESGMVFNNTFINISNLNYPKTGRLLQVIQKPNGDYLASFINSVIDNKEEVKIISFRVLDTDNNVKTVQILKEATILANTNNNHNLNRYLFTNITSNDIIATLDGTDVTTLTVYELVGNTLVARATKDYTLTARMIALVKSGTTSMTIMTMTSIGLETSTISLVDTLSINLDVEELELDPEEDATVIDKIANINSIGSSGGKVRLDGAILKKNNILFTIENDSDDVDLRLFEYFKYNVSTKKIEHIDTISSVGRDYTNRVLYGFNYIRTKKNKEPLRLIAES